MIHQQRKFLIASALMLVVGLGLCVAQAQDSTTTPPPASGDRSSRMAEYRQRLLDQLKEMLAPTEDEWKVIQPKVEKIETLRMQSMTRGGFGMGGPGGRGQGGGRGRREEGGNANNAQASNTDRPQTALSKAHEELRQVLEDKASTPDVIKTKIEAYRSARDAARKEIAAAQKDLREILTLRQEAQLINLGLLD